MTLFTNRVAVVDEMRKDRLMLAAASAMPSVALTDDYIYSKLLSAEADISTRLRVHLEPTVLVPYDAPQAELDALENSGQRWAQEPAYDYEQSFFIGDRWGYIVSISKPIISVQSLRFVYPSVMNQVFEVPSEWIRMDKKYGHIRLVPSTQAFAAPLGAFLLSAMSGGRMVPFMIQLRYTAGLQNVERDWPQIMDVIKKRAVVGMLSDAFLPQSGSISADGLSQSMSVDMDKYMDSIDHMIDGGKGSNGGLVAAIHGIRLGILG